MQTIYFFIYKKNSKLSNVYYMVLKFCVYCQEKTHYINKYNIWECSNCEPLSSESEESSDDESHDSYFIDDTD